MTKPLSPAALAVWEAFNQDEAGVFVDYGDKLAAALRAAMSGVEGPSSITDLPDQQQRWYRLGVVHFKRRLFAIAAELEAQ